MIPRLAVCSQIEMELNDIITRDENIFMKFASVRSLLSQDRHEMIAKRAVPDVNSSSASQVSNSTDTRLLSSSRNELQLQRLGDIVTWLTSIFASPKDELLVVDIASNFMNQDLLRVESIIDSIAMDPNTLKGIDKLDAKKIVQFLVSHQSIPDDCEAVNRYKTKTTESSKEPASATINGDNKVQ